MPTKTRKGWKCLICDKLYAHDTDALSCEQGHDVVYVPFMREDLFKLNQFIITRDDSLLSESLMRVLRRYNRGYYK